MLQKLGVLWPFGLPVACVQFNRFGFVLFFCFFFLVFAFLFGDKAVNISRET